MPKKPIEPKLPNPTIPGELRLIRHELSHLRQRGEEIAQFWQQKVIADLSVELARLRGSSLPGPMAAEAARLLADCRKAWESELARPALEQRAAMQQYATDAFNSSSVRWDRICRPRKPGNGKDEAQAIERFEFLLRDESGQPASQKPIQFDWIVYTTVKGWKGGLRNYWDRSLCKDYQAAITSFIKSHEGHRKHPIDPREVCAALEAHGLLIPDALKEATTKIKTLGQLQKWARNWLKTCAREVPERISKSAQTGQLDVVTLWRIHQKRNAGKARQKESRKSSTSPAEQ